MDLTEVSASAACNACSDVKARISVRSVETILASIISHLALGRLARKPGGNSLRKAAGLGASTDGVNLPPLVDDLQAD